MYHHKIPSLLPVEITTKCNLRCSFCRKHNEESSKGEDISNALLYEKIVPLAKKVGNVLFCGYGEPFANENIIDYIKIFSESKIPVFTATNGILINNAIQKKVIEYKNLKISFSIDSLDEETYYTLRGVPLTYAINNLIGLIQNGFDTNKLSVSAIIKKENIGFIYKYPKFLNDLKIKNLSLAPFHEILSTYDDSMIYTIPDYKYELNRIEEECRKYKIRLYKLNPQRIKSEMIGDSTFKNHYYDNDKNSITLTKNCFTAWGLTQIDTKGNIYPCVYHLGSKYILGNLYEKDFWDIWNGSKYEHFRDSLLQKNGAKLSDICKGCNYSKWVKHHSLDSSYEVMKFKLKHKVKRAKKIYHFIRLSVI